MGEAYRATDTKLPAEPERGESTRSRPVSFVSGHALAVDVGFVVPERSPVSQHNFLVMKETFHVQSM
jgi:hypothetical protein